MTRFKYRAKKGPKEIVEASIEAESENAAVNTLLESGFHLVWIKEEKEKPSFFPQKIKTKDLANFTRELSDLLDSGLGLFDSLNIIENQTASPQLKGIISTVKAHIRDGSTFSDSLKTYPPIFSNLYVNLVKSGEVGSMLNEVLANISDFLEKQEDIRSKVIAALTYPVLMTAVGFITIAN